MGTLNILGKEGDLTYSWDPNSGEQVEERERLFDDMIKRGYLAFEVTGDVNEQIRSFKPRAKAIVMAPRLVGG